MDVSFYGLDKIGEVKEPGDLLDESEGKVKTEVEEEGVS